MVSDRRAARAAKGRGRHAAHILLCAGTEVPIMGHHSPSLLLSAGTAPPAPTKGSACSFSMERASPGWLLAMLGLLAMFLRRRQRR